jgi:hypothetical protein
VRLPAPAVPTPVPTRPGRIHGMAIVAMALSAVIGFVALFAFITIGWPGRTGRYVIAVVVFSVVAFMVSAAIAVFAAARDTYARKGTRKEG